MSVLYSYFYSLSMYIYKNHNICISVQIICKMFKTYVYFVKQKTDLTIKSISQIYKSSEFVVENSLLYAYIQYIIGLIELIFIHFL